MAISKADAFKMRVFETYNILRTDNPDKEYVTKMFARLAAIAHKDKGGEDGDMIRVLKGKQTLLDVEKLKNYLACCDKYGLKDGDKIDPEFEAKVDRRKAEGKNAPPVWR